MSAKKEVRGVKGKLIGNSSIQLTWHDPDDDDVDHTEIQYKARCDETWTWDRTKGREPYYNINNIKCNETYDYLIVHANAESLKDVKYEPFEDQYDPYDIKHNAQNATIQRQHCYNSVLNNPPTAQTMDGSGNTAPRTSTGNQQSRQRGKNSLNGENKTYKTNYDPNAMIHGAQSPTIQSHSDNSMALINSPIRQTTDGTSTGNQQSRQRGEIPLSGENNSTPSLDATHIPASTRALRSQVHEGSSHQFSRSGQADWQLVQVPQETNGTNNTRHDEANNQTVAIYKTDNNDKPEMDDESEEDDSAETAEAPQTSPYSMKNGLTVHLIGNEVATDVFVHDCLPGDSTAAESVKYKTLLLVGARKSGKSTMANALINNLLGKKWGDSDRYQLARSTQTTKCTTYYELVNIFPGTTLKIIDTPGIDTLSEARDQTLMKKLGTHISDIDPLTNTTIAFVTPASVPDTFKDALAVPKKIRNELSHDKKFVLFVTFTDSAIPPILTDVQNVNDKGVKLFDEHFMFNNASLFNNPDKPQSVVSETLWSMCEESALKFKDFILKT